MKLFDATLLALAACATPGILNAPSGPGTSRPCGLGIVCFTPTGQPSGFCCPSDNVCGGQQPDTFVSCPAGSCCFSGSAADFDTALGMRKPTPQTRAK